MTSRRESRPPISMLERTRRVHDAGGVQSRHGTYYWFANNLLPSLLEGPTGMQVIEELLGKRGPNFLAKTWNSIGGPRMSKKDFAVADLDLADRWKVVVVDAPLPMNEDEAYLIGIWIDYEPNSPLPGGKEYSNVSEHLEDTTENAVILRYFCLERSRDLALWEPWLETKYGPHHPHRVTRIVEWVLGSDRLHDLGPGVDPSDPKAFIWCLGSLHGIEVNFGNSWEPPDQTPLVEPRTGITRGGQLPVDTTRGSVRVKADDALLGDPHAAMFDVATRTFEAVRHMRESLDEGAVGHSEHGRESGGGADASDAGSSGSQETVTGQKRKQRPRPASIANELKKLAELRSEGVLTEDEFQELKRQLIEDV